MKRGCGLPPIGLPSSPIHRMICLLLAGPLAYAGSPVEPSGSTNVVRNGALPWPNVHLAERRVELAVREQLVLRGPAREPPRIERLKPAGRPHLQRLVVVAAEDVERVGRRDRDLRLLLRRREDRLHREAEILGRLLRDVRDGELDAEGEHPQRAGELAGGVDLAGGSRCRCRRACQRAQPADHRRAGAAACQELTTGQPSAFVLPPVGRREVASTQIRPGLDLLRMLVGVVLPLPTHTCAPFPSRLTRVSTLGGCRTRESRTALARYRCRGYDGLHLALRMAPCIQPARAGVNVESAAESAGRPPSRAGGGSRSRFPSEPPSGPRG